MTLDIYTKLGATYTHNQPYDQYYILIGYYMRKTKVQNTFSVIGIYHGTGFWVIHATVRYTMSLFVCFILYTFPWRNCCFIDVHKYRQT